MVQEVAAIFQNGVFKPDRPPNLEENARVRLIVESDAQKDDQTETERAWVTLQRLWRDSKFNSHGDRLTREQLHERR